jgi:myo-inositol 2-dehydrogenase / D-chiro-inositol 1-dehydrogenase
MRVGIVGAGTMGAVHAAGWKSTDATLVGVMSKNQASALEVGKRFETRVFGTYEDLLNEVDIIDICVPTDFHKDLVLQAAKLGRHIICEKPIALTIEDGQTMIEACKAAKVRLFIAMVVRFFPQYSAAQQAVANGQIGNIGVMRLKRVAYQPIGDEAWFTDEARSGGMLVDLMIHDFDYARWLGGEVKRVFAKSVRGQDPNAPSDYALVTLGFDDGRMALVEGGWAYPPGVFRTALDIAGSDGVIEWRSDDALTIQPFLKPKGEAGVARVGVPSSILAEDPYTTEIKHAYDCIKNNKPFLVTAEGGLEALRIALAAKESLKTGKAVMLGGLHE